MKRDTEFTPEDMRTFFHRFVGEVADSPLYAALCPLLAEFPFALALYADVPGTQRRPNLLLAALHYEVLRDPSHPFAEWFKTVNGTRLANEPELREALTSFVTERYEILRNLVARGATQTNEVGRSALVLPALAVLGAEQSKPVAIVEIGTSAGLNLSPDAYKLNYKLANGTTVTVGPQHSTVHIATDNSNTLEALPLAEMRDLQLGMRIGVDINPLDVTNEFQARWLCALIWPDDQARFARLRAAVDLAASDPLDLHRGDAVETVGAHITSVLADQYPVVVTTWVLTYLTKPQRQAFGAALDTVAQKRDFAWVAMEHPAYAKGLPWPEAITSIWTPEFLQSNLETWTGLGTPLVLHRYASGRRTSQWIASVHAHGHWINWHPTAPPTH